MSLICLLCLSIAVASHDNSGNARGSLSSVGSDSPNPCNDNDGKIYIFFFYFYGFTCTAVYGTPLIFSF